MNRLFNWLPLAALIEKKIICMHGGIGRSINHVEQIENLQRPITMEAGSVVLMDLLWLAFSLTPTVHPPIIGTHFISYLVLTFTGLIQQRMTVLKD
jgi:protein phosphatase